MDDEDFGLLEMQQYITRLMKAEITDVGRAKTSLSHRRWSLERMRQAVSLSATLIYGPLDEFPSVDDGTSRDKNTRYVVIRLFAGVCWLERHKPLIQQLPGMQLPEFDANYESAMKRPDRPRYEGV